MGLANAAISQTPRLKANTMTSPILGPYSQEPTKTKRAISVLDRDFDLMGLSRNNAVHDGDSFFMDEDPPSIEPLKSIKNDSE